MLLVMSQLTGFIFSDSEVNVCVSKRHVFLSAFVCSVFYNSSKVLGSLCQSDFPSVNRLAASAAHVVHYAIALAYAGAKYWLIFVLVLAISSDFFGLPGFLPVLM